VAPNKPSFKQGSGLMNQKILPSFRGQSKYEMINMPPQKAPFVESNSCLIDFPAQNDVIGFSWPFSVNQALTLLFCNNSYVLLAN